MVDDTDHTHEKIFSVAFVILEHDVWVVVDDQTLEPVGTSVDPALRRTTGCQRRFGRVGHVLVEHERSGPLPYPSTSVAASRTAWIRRMDQHHRQCTQKKREEPWTHLQRR